MDYIKQGKYVYYQGKPLWNKEGNIIADVDVDSFISIGKRYAKDKNKVYVQAQQGSDRAYIYFYTIAGADLESFQVLNERYAKDKYHAYYVTEKTIRTKSSGAFEIVPYREYCGISPDTLQEVFDSSKYARDSENVYLAGKIIKKADPVSFEAVFDDYFKDKKHVFYGNILMEKADRKTFINGELEVYQGAASDKNRSYRWGKPQSISSDYEYWTPYFNSHPGLSDYWWHKEGKRLQKDAVIKDLGNGYTTDGIKVYLKNVSLDEIEVHSFKDLGDFFIADKNGLYRYPIHNNGLLRGKKLKNGDPGTFHPLAYGYYMDKYNAYLPRFDETICARVDINSFEVLNMNFSKDKNFVYYQLRRKNGMHGLSARLINDNYIRDKESIWYHEKRLKEIIDPDACEMLHPNFIREGKVLYFKHMKRNKKIHVPSLQFLNYYFAKDSHTIYYYLREVGLFELKEADYTSFQIVEEFLAKDQYRNYDVKKITDDYYSKY